MERPFAGSIGILQDCRTPQFNRSSLVLFVFVPFKIFDCKCVEDDTYFKVRSIVTGNERYYWDTLLCTSIIATDFISIECSSAFTWCFGISLA